MAEKSNRSRLIEEIKEILPEKKVACRRVGIFKSTGRAGIDKQTLNLKRQELKKSWDNYEARVAFLKRI